MKKLLLIFLILIGSVATYQTRPHVTDIEGDWPTSRISNKAEFDIRDYAAEADPFAAVVTDALAVGSTSVILIDENCYSSGTYHNSVHRRPNSF